jgi:hypothetical protein
MGVPSLAHSRGRSLNQDATRFLDIARNFGDFILKLQVWPGPAIQSTAAGAGIDLL